MEYADKVKELKSSLAKQKVEFDSTLILNPVENIPDPDILEPCSSFLHGLYNTDTVRNAAQKMESKIQFSGRSKITEDINQIYAMWQDILGGEAISMRLLSGLHAHIVLFMSITDIGQKVLALPEKAGGHVASYAILKRLGLQVRDIPFDCKEMKVDRHRCIEEIESFQPDIIFVDRSEGLIYEDFSWLGQYKTQFSCYKIFDASQYLTNIICHDYTSPFEMGFDLILSTLHKNLPGPQRALVCAKESNETWRRLRTGISTYVSNMLYQILIFVAKNVHIAKPVNRTFASKMMLDFFLTGGLLDMQIFTQAIFYPSILPIICPELASLNHFHALFTHVM